MLPVIRVIVLVSDAVLCDPIFFPLKAFFHGSFFLIQFKDLKTEGVVVQIVKPTEANWWLTGFDWLIIV